MDSRKISLQIIAALLIFFVSTGAQSNTADILSDVKVVCLYEDADNIDRALIYYLVAEKGCRVDLVTLEAGIVYKNLSSESQKYDLTSSEFFIPDTSKAWLDSVVRDFYADYPPDIVFLAEDFGRPEMLAFENYLTGLEYDSARIFNIVKIFRRVDHGDEQSIYLNSRMYLDNHYHEIAEMAAGILEESPASDKEDVYTAYELVKDNTVGETDSPSFLSGVDRFKLERLTEKYIESPVRRETLDTYGENYISYLSNALQQTGRARMESLADAMGEMKRIRTACEDMIGAADYPVPLMQYVEQKIRSLAGAVLREGRIDWKGEAFIRETTEGRRLKFRSNINNNGPAIIQAGWVEFKPSWSDTTVIIDSSRVEILPGNSLIREYTIEATPEQLEMIREESLEFTGRILYADHELDFHYRAAALEKTVFSLEIVPDFLIIRPFPELRIDRLVEPTRLKAILKKPGEYSGNVHIDVVTPETIHAGAYEEEIMLNAGEPALELRIPMVVTKSMGFKRHNVVISIIDNGKILASDTAYVRQAEHDIPTNKKIALLPGVTGLLEDILIQTGADYKSISDRLLLAGELEFYDAVLFGPGSFGKCESLENAYGRIKKFIEFGGTVIVFGQPGNNKRDLLPVSISSIKKRLSGEKFAVQNSDHAIFKRKFKIELSKLLDRMSAGYLSCPAEVFPGEKIIEGPDDTTLLSVTKLGEGRLVYCGLPLLEMVRDLDTDAIKLLSNLINYTGK